MADYSTTIGVFQSQVGKSGDILLKFEHKNGGERGIRTLGELPLGGFQDRCLKPLDHFSAKCFYLKYHRFTDFTNRQRKFYIKNDNRELLKTTRKKKNSGRGKPIKLRQRSSATPRSGTFAAKKWQTYKDSNLDKVNQNHLCYRYTIGLRYGI